MNMIKKTQYKFIAITLGAISLVLAFILGILNFSIYVGILITADSNIEQIQQRRGFIFNQPAVFNEEPDEFRADNFPEKGKASYIYVRVHNNQLTPPLITSNMTDTYTADEIFSIANKLMESNIDSGFYGNMRYEIIRDNLYTTVTAIDLKNDLNLMRNVFNVSVIIIIASLIFVFIVSYFLSRWAIKPLKESFEKQRRFISDASHELKTPLAVISANADVLETEIGDNKWLDNIKNQSKIMSDLVFDLLDLAKMDETSEKMLLSEFDLSNTVLSKALEFECTAFECGKTFEQNITENIRYKGNEEAIKHLVTILIDNAIKHSDENGIVRVTLTTAGNKKILQVYNTGNSIRNSEKDKIFNRFYRSDESRSKATGGYGLGLSIAKAITDAHKGTITVDGEENKWISFTVIL